MAVKKIFIRWAMLKSFDERTDGRALLYIEAAHCLKMGLCSKLLKFLNQNDKRVMECLTTKWTEI